MKQRICIIINSCDGLDLKLINEFKSQGFDIRLYLDEKNFKNRAADLSEFNAIEVNSKNLEQQLSSDLKNQSASNLIIFEQEITDNWKQLLNAGTDSFKIIRFCPFSFLVAYRYNSPADVKYANGSAGYFATIEKRIFNPGENHPVLNFLYGHIPSIANTPARSSALIYNKYYSVGSVSQRAGRILENVFNPVQPDSANYFDIALHYLFQQSLSLADWNIKKSLASAGKCPLLKFTETYICLSAQDRHSYLALQIDLTTNYLKDFPEAAFLLSEIAGKSDNRDQAKEILLSIYNKLPVYPAVLQKLGKVLIKEKDYQRALEYINECLQIDPCNHICLLDHSQLMIMARKFEAALYAIEKAQLSPNCEPRAYLQLASVYKHKGLIDQTINCLQKFVDLVEASELNTENKSYKNALPNIKKELKDLRSGK